MNEGPLQGLAYWSLRMADSMDFTSELCGIRDRTRRILRMNIEDMDRITLYMLRIGTLATVSLTWNVEWVTKPMEDSWSLVAAMGEEPL